MPLTLIIIALGFNNKVKFKLWVNTKFKILSEKYNKKPNIRKCFKVSQKYFILLVYTLVYACFITIIWIFVSLPHSALIQKLRQSKVGGRRKV